MKKNNFRMLAMMLFSMIVFNVSAHDIAVANADGVTIYYNYTNNGKELEVAKSPGYYKGNVVIPDEVTYMNITRKVTGIGVYAFEYCSDLTSITIPSNVTNIGFFAFYFCDGLKKVIVKDIAAWCGINFSDNYSNPLYYAHHLYSNEYTEITELVIPNCVTSIGYGAFSDCYSLTSATIPNSVTSIEGSTFSGCISLTSVTIPNSVKNIGNNAFNGCYHLTSVTIPNSVTTIGVGAFFACYHLTSVTIPNSVESIGESAFNGIYLTSVASLIENPFEIAGKNSDNPSFHNDTFNNATLYVPIGTIDKYKSTAGWKDFRLIEEWTGEEGGSDPVTLETKKCATPTISIVNGELEFSCETEGVEYVSEVTVADAKKNYSSKVSLTGVYKVSVYAMKDGYENSDVATAEFTMSGGGMKGDVNVDGKVNALDIQEVINIAAAVE